MTKTFNQLVEVQQRLFRTDPDTHYMLNASKDTKNGGKKRKLSQSDDEDQKDDDDEEIYSDTDEENQANERKKLKNEATKLSSTCEVKSLKPEQFEASLEAINKNFHKYRLILLIFVVVASFHFISN